MKVLTKQRVSVKARKPRRDHPWRTHREADSQLLPTAEELEFLPIPKDQDVLDEYATDNDVPGKEDWRDFSELE